MSGLESALMKERAEHNLSVQQMRQKYEQASRAGDGDVSRCVKCVRRCRSVFGLHVPAVPAVPSVSLKMHYTIAAHVVIMVLTMVLAERLVLARRLFQDTNIAKSEVILSTRRLQIWNIHFSVTKFLFTVGKSKVCVSNFNTFTTGPSKASNLSPGDERYWCWLWDASDTCLSQSTLFLQMCGKCKLIVVYVRSTIEGGWDSGLIGAWYHQEPFGCAAIDWSPTPLGWECWIRNWEECDDNKDLTLIHHIQIVGPGKAPMTGFLDNPNTSNRRSRHIFLMLFDDVLGIVQRNWTKVDQMIQPSWFWTFLMFLLPRDLSFTLETPCVTQDLFHTVEHRLASRSQNKGRWTPINLDKGLAPLRIRVQDDSMDVSRPLYLLV